MAVESPRTGPHAGLLDWLAGRHVEHELHEHPETFTAEATARAEHLDPHLFAKAVGVVASDGRQVLLLVDADDHVDLVKARRALGVDDVRVMTESEFAALAPDCEAGTVPPIPELFGVPVCADFAIRDWPRSRSMPGAIGTRSTWTGKPGSGRRGSPTPIWRRVMDDRPGLADRRRP